MEPASAAAAPAGARRSARLLQLASDERLVALVRAGEGSAFAAIYDRHHGPILGFCRHMLGSREEAEDALQHTFLAAYRDLVASAKPIELRPWLFAIARNRCLSLLRARREHLALELAEPATDGLAATVERREDLRELLGDVARLPEDQRAALLLAELGGLDHAGIATVLDCPREKVKALVFQARSSLVASREARATPCEQIRLELATATGAALRRGPLRRHLRACAGCRTFKAEVSAQRALLALALPVAPSAALKAGVLSSLGIGAHGGAASAGTASGALGGVLASSPVAKVAVSLAIVGAVAGGGAIAIHQRAPAAAHASTASRAHVAPAATRPLAAHADDLAATRSRAHRAHRRAPTQPGTAGSGTSAPQLDAHSGPSSLGAGSLGAPAGGAPHGADRTATPGAQPGTPPPGRGGTPPGRGGTPPGRGAGGASPGNSGNAPGRGSTPPGQGGTPPSQGGTAPGQSAGGSSSGDSGDAPSQGGTPPGHGGTAPGQSQAHGHDG
jgi:RNA polymerase sigma factor (sigma-70 family)